MKPIVYRNPHLALRIATSVIIQVLLVILLHRSHQDSLLFSLLIMAIAGLALVPLCIKLPCLNLRITVSLGLAGILPQSVVVATWLHLVGWSGFLHWLVKVLP
jgi:hypothetical protein